MAPRRARGSVVISPLPRAKTRGLAILGVRLISRGPGSGDRDGVAAISICGLRGRAKIGRLFYHQSRIRFWRRACVARPRAVQRKRSAAWPPRGGAFRGWVGFRLSSIYLVRFVAKFLSDDTKSFPSTLNAKPFTSEGASTVAASS